MVSILGLTPVVEEWQWRLTSAAHSRLSEHSREFGGFGPMFPCTENHRFPIGPLPRRPRPRRVWAGGPRSTRLYTGDHWSTISTWENLSISNPLELSLRSWAFLFSHKLLGVLSPLFRSEPRRLEGIYHVVICANICCSASFSFRFMDSCRDFVYMCILSP